MYYNYARLIMFVSIVLTYKTKCSIFYTLYMRLIIFHTCYGKVDLDCLMDITPVYELMTECIM